MTLGSALIIECGPRAIKNVAMDMFASCMSVVEGAE
jgi:hypothetical protein